jgi:hypothetical protein
MVDTARDVAYIQLKATWAQNPSGWSTMLLPPDVPKRVDLFFDADDRLELIRVEGASENLVTDALENAVPFAPVD